MFPPEFLTPVSKVVQVVISIVDGEIEKTGQTVEICGFNHYFRKQIEFCDGTMQALMSVGS